MEAITPWEMSENCFVVLFGDVRLPRASMVADGVKVDMANRSEKALCLWAPGPNGDDERVCSVGAGRRVEIQAFGAVAARRRYRWRFKGSRRWAESV